MRAGLYLLLATSAWLVASSAAFAANNCTFRSVGRVMQLQSNCWTDATLLIPDGATLDGRNRTITAVDPDAGHFVGAVIRNAGATAYVRNLTIEARGLLNVCDSAGPPDERLRGILFDAASGAITGNRVLDIRQVGSGCQEGAAIEVKNPAASPTQSVTIVDNRIENYQKTGVLVSGAVDANIMLNRITGLGPVDYIAQNGIQVASGARAHIQWNRIEQNIYTGSGAASTGILLIRAGAPVEIEINRVEDNDVGIRVVSTSDSVVQWNEVSGSTFDGIAIDGLQAEALGNQVVRNRVTDNAIGIDVFGANAVGNEVIGNRISFSSVMDIQNTGDNTYRNNRCTTSSGPPVDCP